MTEENAQAPLWGQALNWGLNTFIPAYGASQNPTGAWGTKEFGLTETAGNTLGANQTPQGGSNLLGPTSQNAQNTAYINQPYYVGPNSPKITNPVSKTSSSSGQVLGDTNVPTPEGIDPLLAEVDNMYNAAMGYANEAQGNINAAQPGVYDAINAGASASLQQADTSKAASERYVGAEKTDAGTRNQNYMALARQALSESGLGAKQRFGGASNISRALGEYAAVNFQKQAGQAQQTLESTISKLNELWTQTQESYTTTVAQVKQWQASAVSQAQQEFTNQLNQVAQMKMGASENRSTQKLSLLAQYRDNLNTIKMTAWQYAEQAKQNAQSQLSTFQNYYNQIAGTAQTTGSNIGTQNAQANSAAPNALTYGTAGTTQNPAISTGNINKKTEYDQFGNPISPMNYSA